MQLLAKQVAVPLDVVTSRGDADKCADTMDNLPWPRMEFCQNIVIIVNSSKQSSGPVAARDSAALPVVISCLVGNHCFKRDVSAMQAILLASLNLSSVVLLRRFNSANLARHAGAHRYSCTSLDLRIS